MKLITKKEVQKAGMSIEYQGVKDEDGDNVMEEVDEASVQSSINKILTDETLTPFEQMQLLNTIKAHSDEAKSYVDKYFTEDDVVFPSFEK